MDERRAPQHGRDDRARRSDRTGTVAMVAVGALLAVVVLVDGDRLPSAWGLSAVALAAGAIVLVAMTVVVLRRRSSRTAGPVAPDVDATRADDPLPAWDFIDADATWIALEPRPLWARRLVDHPDALWLTADRDGLSVPAWLLEGRPRVIDSFERVLVPWTAIDRFRVRPRDDQPARYEITTRVERGTTRVWRVRRAELVEEVRLLDHVRTAGGVTIELGDTIRSS